MKEIPIKIGDRFNRLVILDIIKGSEKKYIVCKCVCDCGKIVFKKKNGLTDGKNKSCWCLRVEHMKKLGIENTKHGHSRTKIYNCWCGIIDRCKRKANTSFKNYGGRGITVSDEWLKFENFFRDMGDVPVGMSIDRINNEIGYCKENCKWSTATEQADNTRRTRHITIGGETRTLFDWAKRYSMRAGTIRKRIYDGWSDVDAIIIPIRKIKKSITL